MMARCEPPSGGCAGFSLLETVIALGVVGAIALGIAAGMRAAQVSHEEAERTRVAFEAVQAEIERAKSMTVRELLEKARAERTWTFSVPGLEGPVAGVPPGQVRLLTEQEAAVALQLPELDLNFNGVENETQIDPGFRLLVFEVRVDWRSPAGVQSLRFVASTTDNAW